MATQAELAQQMIAQLRVLDPSISAEVGTPERKIIDTVAQALAESQVDLNVLNGALDIDSKFGSDLDRFLSIFGFGRQQGSRATGFVTFSRVTPSTFDIQIPLGTQIIAPLITTSIGPAANVLFSTTDSVTLTAGDLSILAPVQCALIGTIGNVAANTITDFGGQTILGITAVGNLAPTNGGLNPEPDDQLKLRFKNTVFRNLSGTQDQYLALAVSTAFTTKANVVGPISRYREYLQVPDVDDATTDPDSGISGNGNSGEWTSALSTIPYSKHVYETSPTFISNGSTGIDAKFYRQDMDYVLNPSGTSRDRGDAFRARVMGGGPSALDNSAPYQPNLTFRNVYTGTDDAVEGLRPKDVVLFEHPYMSTASRNDWRRQLTNCVDIYVNGQNPTTANTVIPRPTGGQNLFTGNPVDAFYSDNFRRIGEPEHRPVQGNIFTGLFWQPTMSVPDQITVGNVTYILNTHYWAVEDISELRGTVRSRNGIEWSTGVNGRAQSDADEGPYTGAQVSANSATSITVEEYFYDKNIIDLQAAVDGNKQVTTDPLAHSSKSRYFKLDLTIMYTQGANIVNANAAIRDSVATFMDGQYFGTTLQLSDILAVVHDTPGVDNVRWSKDILVAQGLTVDVAGTTRDRVSECDIDGNRLLNIQSDRKVTGDGGTTEVWQYYFTGGINAGTYTIAYGGNTTGLLAFDATSGVINTALTNASIPASITAGTRADSQDPYILTFSAPGVRTSLTFDTSRLQSTNTTTLNNNDFYLKDDELPSLPLGIIAGDTLAGLILRPRAQNTWTLL